MRKKEQQLWDTMRRQFAMSPFWLQRVENVVIAGMPDVYVANKTGESVWVELKAPTRPKRPTTRVLGTEGLNPSQINWHLTATASWQLRTYILIRCGNELYAVEGEHACSVNDWDSYDLEPFETDWHNFKRML